MIFVDKTIKLTLDSPELPKRIKKLLSGLPSQEALLLAAPNPRVTGIAIGLLDYFTYEELAKLTDASCVSFMDTFPNLKINLRDYQAKAVEQLMKVKRGWLVAPTGSGKTIMALALAAHLKMRTLYVTHRVQLAEQVREVVRSCLEIEPGFVGAGKRREGKFLTIAIAQSIVKNPLSDFYGMIIIDESHHLPTRSLSIILHDYAAARRYGMTATLSRSDKRDKLFPYLIGKTKIEIELKDVKDWVNIPSVQPVYTNLDGAMLEFCQHKCKIFSKCSLFPQKKTLQCDFVSGRMYQFLTGWVDQPERNQQIIGRVMELLDKGLGHICILTNRRKHTKTLMAGLKNYGIETFLALGGAKSAESSKEIFDVVGGVLVGTESLLAEGTDFPLVDALVLAAPAGGKAKVAQRVGRIMRGEGAKLVIDVVDGDEYSKRLWFARCATYRKLGIEILRGEKA